MQANYEARNVVCLFFLRIFLLKDYQSFLHAFLKYAQNNLEYQYDPSGNSNLSFHVGADFIN